MSEENKIKTRINVTGDSVSRVEVKMPNGKWKTIKPDGYTTIDRKRGAKTLVLKNIPTPKNKQKNDG